MPRQPAHGSPSPASLRAAGPSLKSMWMLQPTRSAPPLSAPLTHLHFPSRFHPSMHPVILMFTIISNLRAILGQDLAWCDNSVSPSSCMGSRTGTHLTYACHDVGTKDQSNLLQRLHDLHFTWPCLPLWQHFLTALHLQAMPWLMRVAAVNSAWIRCKKNVV